MTEAHAEDGFVHLLSLCDDFKVRHPNHVPLANGDVSIQRLRRPVAIQQTTCHLNINLDDNVVISW